MQHRYRAEPDKKSNDTPPDKRCRSERPPQTCGVHLTVRQMQCFANAHKMAQRIQTLLQLLDRRRLTMALTDAARDSIGSAIFLYQDTIDHVVLRGERSIDTLLVNSPTIKGAADWMYQCDRIWALQEVNWHWSIPSQIENGRTKEGEQPWNEAISNLKWIDQQTRGDLDALIEEFANQRNLQSCTGILQ